MDDGQPYRARYDADTGVLIVGGAIDELTTAQFRDALRDATEEYARPVVVDLEAVTFLPSMAIGTLMGAMARAPGTRAVAPEGCAARMVLDVLGLYDYAVTGRPRQDSAD